MGSAAVYRGRPGRLTTRWSCPGEIWGRGTWGPSSGEPTVPKPIDQETDQPHAHHGEGRRQCRHVSPSDRAHGRPQRIEEPRSHGRSGIQGKSSKRSQKDDGDCKCGDRETIHPWASGPRRPRRSSHVLIHGEHLYGDDRPRRSRFDITRPTPAVSPSSTAPRPRDDAGGRLVWLAWPTMGAACPKATRSSAPPRSCAAPWPVAASLRLVRRRDRGYDACRTCRA